jgi:hypothetical protein
VYRAPDAAAPVSPAADAPPPAPSESESDSDSLLTFAVDLMTTGFVVIARINVMAFNVMTAPFRLASRFF